jgi:hypothetical protein
LLVEDQRIVVRYSVGVRAFVVDRESLAVCRQDAVHTADHFAILLERELAGVASIALPAPLSASGLPVSGWSLPSYARAACIDISLPSAPTIF